RHSLKLADALFRAGKDFELLPLSGFTHLVPDPVVMERLETRIASFFQKHLGKPEARWCWTNYRTTDTVGRIFKACGRVVTSCYLIMRMGNGESSQAIIGRRPAGPRLRRRPALPSEDRGDGRLSGRLRCGLARSGTRRADPRPDRA